MKKLVFMGLILLLTACARRTFHSDITASTRVSSIGEYKILGNVEATACNKWILFFPFGANYKSMYKETFDRTTELGGDAMIDFQVRSKRVFYLYPIVFFDCWEATGTAIKMGNGGSFEEKSSVWDKPLESKKPENENPAPSKWDKAPK